MNQGEGKNGEAKAAQDNNSNNNNYDRDQDKNLTNNSASASPGRVQQQSASSTAAAEPQTSSNEPPISGGPTAPRRPRPRPLVIRSNGYAMPISTAKVELAGGVLQPAGRATMMPPKRPNYLPAHAAHHRYQGSPMSTNLGATALTSGANIKPNRYNWAKMQQWHASQNLARDSLYEQKQQQQHDQHHPEAAPIGGPVGGGGGPRPGFHYHFPAPFSAAASRVLVVPNPIVNLGEHTKSRLIKIIEALKHFSEKWFSHVLLLLFLASYACLGAYIFISFEASNEQWEKQLIIDTRSRIVNDSYDLAHDSSREDYFEVFRSRFEEYERLLNKVCASGMTSSSLENQWTFWGALFYSMTVFTTIGYGHLTPITFAGRCATMVYAIFGIPILLMVLADLGKLLTRIIKYAFKKFRYFHNKLLGRKASVRTRQLITDHSNQYIGVARNAFERGYATYIQPYGSRIRGASMRMSRRRHEARPREQYHGAAHEQEASQMIGVMAAADGGEAPLMESSDIIVTPVLQTKPVSPKISKTTKSSGKSHPLASKEDQQQQQAQAKQAADKSTNHNRSLSPSGQHAARRKISSSSKHKQSVSRSSSVSNVATAGKLATAADSQQQQQQSNLGSLDDVHAEQVLPNEIGSNNSAKLVGGEIGADHLDEDSGRLTSVMGPDELEAAEAYETELDDDLDIPVSFALFLLITYMMFGAVIFSIWESWNFFDSLYFVFISMSTIGFGDLVPQHPKRMIGTFAYLLFGLALTSMCINVVQEKIHATFLRAKMQIGEKMGFDLDQIMADDYFEGGSAFGDELDDDHMAGLDEDEGSHTNSVTMSQADSSAGHHQHHQHHSQQQRHTNSAHNQHSGDSQKAPASLEGADTATSAAANAPAAPPNASKLKSKESIKWKKRFSGGQSSDQHPAGSSSKRKISAGSKKGSARLSSPTAASGPSSLSQQQSSAADIASQVPIKSQVETIRMMNLPVQLQVDDNKQQSKALAAPLPSINQPVEKKVRSFCEPLRRAFQGSALANNNSSKNNKNNNNNSNYHNYTSKIMIPDRQSGDQQSRAALGNNATTTSPTPATAIGTGIGMRPKLVASHSQPTSLVDHLGGRDAASRYQNGSQQQQQQQQHPQQPLYATTSPTIANAATLSRANMRVVTPTGNGTSPSPSSTASGYGGRRHLHHSERRANNTHSGAKSVSRSLSSSRRASVSHELSQLDDLIVALSCSPPERFGPLLGIPSRGSNRASRSVSPTSPSTNNHNSNSNSIQMATGAKDARQRAGASGTATGASPMIFRPPPVASSITGGGGTRSTRTSVASDFDLSESEAALDELEAVKFSAI